MVDAGPGESQGAVWMGGAAPAVDADGNIWVTAGNGSVTSASHAYDDSDSVLELSPTMSCCSSTSPRRRGQPTMRATSTCRRAWRCSATDRWWRPANRAVVFLLDGSSLGGIGGQQGEPHRRLRQHIRRRGRGRGDDGLPAVPQRSDCRAGLGLSRRPPPALEFVGRGRAAHCRGRARLDHRTRTASSTASIRPPARSRSTRPSGARPTISPPPPSVATSCSPPSANRVVAFTATAAGAPSSTTTTAVAPTTGRATTTSTTAVASGSSSPWVIAAAVVGGLVVLGGATTWLLRRRRRPPGPR